LYSILNTLVTIDKKPKIEVCQKLFENINNMKERNKKILQVIEKGILSI